MNKMRPKDLIEIYGGGDLLNATLLNAISRAIDALMEVGRAIGSSIRRLTSNNICE